MSVTIKLTVKNNVNFAAMSAELQRPTALLKELQSFRRNAFFVLIASGKDARGKRVKRLSPNYAKYKVQRWGSRPIRVASGNMQSTYDSEVIGNQLIETIDSPIAIYHQKGTSKMPQRQLLPESWGDLSKEEKNAIEKLLTNELSKILTNLARSL